MAEWKKILTSGSEGSFTDLTASNLPIITQGQVLGIDGSGNITKFNTSSIATANAVTYVGTGGQNNYITRWTGATTISTSSLQEISGSITIGTPADTGDTVYTDGLFDDFGANTTTIATAVDRFNEVLNGLAPPAAPDVRNLEGVSTSPGVTANLSFGAGDVVSGYISASGTGSVSPMSTAVNKGSSFTRTTNSGTNVYRLGVLTGSLTLTFDINESTTADGSPFTNYPADAFSVPADGGESYLVDINGNSFQITTTGTSSYTDANGFNLSIAQTGSFPSTGLPFVYRRHRTGNLNITSSFFRRGWNFVKVTQLPSKMTNYADWVFDPAQAGTSFSTPTNSTHSFNPTGLKWISGIPYYTGLTFVASGSVPGFYSCSYNTTPITFTSVGTSGSFASTYAVPAPLNFNSNLEASASFTFGTTARALNNVISSTYTATGPGGKTTGTQTISTPTIIIHGTGHTAPTTKIEYFTTESQRVPSASYDDQTSLTNGVYNAATSLVTATSELMYFDNALVYPSVDLSGAVYKAGTVPNYSGLSGTKFLYRRFLHDASQGSTATKTITIPWTGMTSGFVANTTALTTQNAYIHVKIPATTGYRDLLVATPANTTAVQLNDNVGCGDGASITSNTAKTINMGQQNWPASDTRWLVRITTTTGWTGRITQITVT
jgi:hypothetical protein